MGTFSLLGDDTIKIGTRILSDFSSGEVAKVSYPTELASVKTGKNGNTIYVQNAAGFQASLELKLIRGSADDKVMQSYLTSYRSNPTAFVVINAELTKRIGDGSGTVKADTYLLTGGIPTKQVEVVTNTEGDTEQAIAVYTLVFAVSDRALV